MSATTVKERPIIMSGDSVRAIVAGWKSQSRRVIKPQPPAEFDWRFARECAGWYEFEEAYRPLAALAKWSTRCPYGKPGDRLWVRESWREGYPRLNEAPIVYRATSYEDPDDRWRSPMHMPRRASRLMLELTGVRAERLRDITPSDIAAEGIHDEAFNEKYPTTALRDFAMLWDELNARRGYPWSSSLWVWVLEFKRMEG